MKSVQKDLQKFAQDVKGKFSLPIDFHPEDQLKGPVSYLFKIFGEKIGLAVEAATEVRAEQLGRPDIGIAVRSLLTGHVELKAPGKGADPEKFKNKSDREQWERFKNLPNLIYTDANDWALYRTGQSASKIVRLSGDVTIAGAAAIAPADAHSIWALLNDFLRWEPIVPASPTALAKMLAPLCRLLRDDVLTALEIPESHISLLAADWRKYLFPDAGDLQFADAYAQTLTYTLLLARLAAAGESLSIPQAVSAIRPAHRLLAYSLKVLGDDDALEEIKTPVSLLQRVIGAVDPAALARKAKGDPWLYFYEYFLAEYDPKMRKERGVYYTPVEVVQAQVSLAAQLLEERFEADYGFVNPNVITLDPAAGTGTYILAALQHGFDRIEQEKGPGMRAQAATQAAENIHAFELLVGPYAVAHLRLTREILAAGGQLPRDGVHVYLTDTLESPFTPPPQTEALYRELGEEYKRAQRIKAGAPVLVVIGNPPYDRQQIEAADAALVRRKGGWVRYGEGGGEGEGIFRDFLEPLKALGWGVHAKNLYNDYVYFWRWALWKVFEHKGGPGIVSFITASSYLRGPGFAGLRQVMRQTFDDLWIIDLEGDNLGARKTENVFAIQTPVAIAVGVRCGAPRPETAAAVHYTRVTGTEEEKLHALSQVRRFADLPWRVCLSGWTDPLLPTSDKPYWHWPLVTDIFPWQENGLQFKRTWPIGETYEVLEYRWDRLLKESAEKRGLLLRETEARNISKVMTDPLTGKQLFSISRLKPGEPAKVTIRYAYRSFDRQWALMDIRLCDRPRPSLLKAHSHHQVYLTSLLTNVLGEGPSAVAAANIPDLDHFRGSFGGAHVIPLWRDAAATAANLTAGVLDLLARAYGRPVTPPDLFAYAYAVLASPEYVQRFWDELSIPGPRLPVTKIAALFAAAADLGRRLLWLHTYGERFVPPGHKPGRVPPGQARCLNGTPAAPEKYPETFSYDEGGRQLRVGDGRFGPVRPAVWAFSVSGFKALQSWLAYRMKKGAGKKSSELDRIRPERWVFDAELLDLLWVLEHTVDLWPTLAQVLGDILAGDLFTAADFPAPSPAERGMKETKPLFE
ncbi:MAG: DNA methyltransferase [Deltaproteobacteria bacterium]|nr:DNA methyltransferase [Deltaproteobacteria bacterium]